MESQDNKVDAPDTLASLAADAVITDAQAIELGDAVASLENIIICAPSGVDTTPLIAALLSRAIDEGYRVGTISVDPDRYSGLDRNHQIRRAGGLSLISALRHMMLMSVTALGVDSVEPDETGGLFHVMAGRGGYFVAVETQTGRPLEELTARVALEPKCAENPLMWVDKAINILVEYRSAMTPGEPPALTVTRLSNRER